jgi:hypothetical protein
MKKRLWIPICFILIFSAGCASDAGEQAGEDQPTPIPVSENNTSRDMEQDNTKNSDKPLLTQPVEEHGRLLTGSGGADEQTGEDQPTTISVSENNTSGDMEHDNAENNDKPLWTRPSEEYGQLFVGLNLDGIGDYDDEAYVSLYSWDNNASELVVQIRLGTGDTKAHIIHAIGWYQFHTAKLFSEKKDAIMLEVNIKYANSGQVFVFALDVYGSGEADPFPSIVERLNTTGEMPVLSADGEGLYAGSLITGTDIADIENKPLQGIVLRSSGDGSYRGNIAGRDSQIIYWNGVGWIALERWETEL